MADIPYGNQPTVSGVRSVNPLRRAVEALGVGVQALRADLEDWRRDRTLRRLQQELNPHLLRDIGLDRDACS